MRYDKDYISKWAKDYEECTTQRLENILDTYKMYVEEEHPDSYLIHGYQIHIYLIEAILITRRYTR